MKKLIIVISLILLLPVQVIGEPESIQEENTVVESVIPQNEEIVKENIEEMQQETLPYKQPISKKQMAKKFIIAMLCVGGASIFLYIALSLYNKIRDGFVNTTYGTDNGESLLETPQDIEEAVKSFVEKTHWEN